MAINLGSTPISGLYIGSTPISRAYVGSTLVYQAASVAESFFTSAGASTVSAAWLSIAASGFTASGTSDLSAQLPFTPVVVPDTPTVFAADVATFQDATGWPPDPAQTIDTAGIGLSSWDGTQTTNTDIYRNPTPLVSGREYAVLLSAKTTNGFVYGRVAGDGFYQTNSMGINNTAFFPFTAPGNCTDVGFRVNPDFDGDIDTVQYVDLQFVKDRPKDIYITAGQSNMAAGSAQTGFDAFTTPKEPRALFVSGFERSNQGATTDGTGAAINPAWDANYGIGVPRLCAEPLPQASVCLQAIGPVTNIATVICDSGTEAGRSPCFVGSAHGGTSLDTEWNKDDDARCYDLMVANVEAMLAENAGNRVAGLFWCQGESTAAAGYAAKFKAFVDDLRSLWGEFPVVIMEIGEDDTDPTVAAKILEQQKCATGSGDASELTQCAYVQRPTGWAIETDNIHFTGTTNLVRGTEAGQAMLPLLGVTKSITFDAPAYTRGAAGVAPTLDLPNLASAGITGGTYTAHLGTRASATAQLSASNLIAGSGGSGLDFLTVGPESNIVDLAGAALDLTTSLASDAIDVVVVHSGGTQSIVQSATGVTYDADAPTFLSAEVGSINATTLRVTLDKAAYGSAVAGDFTLTSNTISAVTFTPGNAFIDLTLGTAAVFADDYTGDLSFTGTDLIGVDAEVMATFSGEDVTNNVAAPPAGWDISGQTVTSTPTLTAITISGQTVSEA